LSSVQEREEQLVDLRCPLGPRQLLARVIQNDDHHAMTSDNLLELRCRDCAKWARREDPTVTQVLHRFNVLGELVESVVRR
jgi:hypothetical protein